MLALCFGNAAAESSAPRPFRANTRARPPVSRQVNRRWIKRINQTDYPLELTFLAWGSVSTRLFSSRIFQSRCKYRVGRLRRGHHMLASTAAIAPLAPCGWWSRHILGFCFQTCDESRSSRPQTLPPQARRLAPALEMRLESEATFICLCTLGSEFSCARVCEVDLALRVCGDLLPWDASLLSTALLYAGFHWPVSGFPRWPLVWRESARLVSWRDWRRCRRGGKSLLGLRPVLEPRFWVGATHGRSRGERRRATSVDTRRR
jgi:hypothetical protein